MNANVRALKMLEKIKESTGLSEDGKNALIQMINPFADFTAPRVGCPDTNEASSVIQCVKYSQTITAPAVAGTGNWDAHIFTLPVTNPTRGTAQAVLGYGTLPIAATGSTANNFGGVTAITGQAGALCDIFASAPPGSTNVMTSVNLSPSAEGPNPFVAGSSRVVAMGFEVHNTTAAIQLQGSVCVYRLPQTSMFDRTTVNTLSTTGPLNAPTTVSDAGCYSILPIVDVPQSVSQALIMNGAQQWEARYGAMVVPTLNMQSIDVTRLEPVLPVILGETFANVTLPGSTVLPFEQVTVPVSRGVITLSNPAGTKFLRDPFLLNPFNTSGAYFTGLSNSTTLVVNTIYYIERFPDYSVQDLVVLANPSPAYDPLVMSLYASIMRQLPIGVKVRDNADGDWFYEAVSSIARFLKPALSMVPTFGPALAAGAGAISGLAQRQIKDAKPRQQSPSTWTPVKTQQRAQAVANKNAQNWDKASGMPQSRPKKKKAKQPPRR